jgi:PKD-like domain
MSKTHYRLIALALPLALLALVVFAPASAAKKPKKKKPVATENYVYRAPTVQLNASPTVLTACAGEAAQVRLDARTSDLSNAKYRWSSTAGQIDGDGPTPRWDLSGVKPGVYKASVEAYNGLTEECLAFASTAVIVKCAPTYCPSIVISCPDTIDIDQPITFSANVAGGSANIAKNYQWTVSAGTITSGQGTSSITVDTKGLAGQTVTASLVMPGYDGKDCSASCPVQIPNEPPVCRKFDEFRSIHFNDEKARLDHYATELQNDPTSVGYVVIYPGQRAKAGEVLRQTNRVLDYMVNSRGVDKRRIISIIGSAKEELFLELWVCPQGAKAPGTP